MRRSVPLALLLALLLSASAWADHHLMLVNEVAPGGSPADQFIELRDRIPETFPPIRQYSVGATDAAGTVLESQVLTEPLEFRNNTDPFVLGGANVTPRDRALAFTIPPEATRVCFYGGSNPVDCLNYGNVAVPADQSAQRQPCGAVAAATPTPDAANTDTGACEGGGSTPPPGGGPGTGPGTGGGGGTDDPSDLTPPQQIVGGKRRQDVDRLAVRVGLSEAGEVTVRGRVVLPDGAARVVRFRTITRSVAANTSVRIRLRLARKAKRTVKAALGDGRRLRARIRIAARDASGNVSTARRAIRLTD